MPHPSSAALPLPRNGFTLKRFFVAHDRCEMKVGTDSILLGAWLPLRGDERHILDIGSGSGVLALMMAQRSAAQVDGVEIEPGAATQGLENFLASPWPTRLTMHTRSLQAFSAECGRRYDLLVSNPPYFAPGVACRTAARATARYTDSLDHAALLQHAAELSSADGRLALVLPVEAAESVVRAGTAHGWHLLRRTWVRDRADKPVRRALLLFGRLPASVQSNTLDIRDDSSEYSCIFRNMTKDFYLFF
ncbi:methyltransferase [Edwardsiella piscicida]|uniref:tRNA1(Val) (adenine(37)-N6)-methyltransferase n=1 Tax=Edwardsiella piscicida TaxID=1263550 RepID=UPI00084C77F2|nr:methyltransferase [Edwardsiella piscicida]EKS7766322.1 methyltransferase [Edwardsiella piscicida]EKS7793028.1 methyltransferase [Edwardsiella piscicida]ELM3730309.1 methyltransferase [Edwardsiella piscicida]ELV7537510.1 methyltransferase [Edwardsiella piscicida]UCQ30580.1 methyltransferase [Edwardsiella piscicida]